MTSGNIRLFFWIALYLPKFCQLLALCRMYPGRWWVLSPTRKETSSEACLGRARFQQHRDASCHHEFFFLQGKAPKEIHATLLETLACFVPGWAKDLSASLYNPPSHGAVTPSVPSGLQAEPLQGKAPKEIHAILTEILACLLSVGLRTYQHPCITHHLTEP